MDKLLLLALRVGLTFSLSLAVAAVLGRVSGALWWQLLPWVLLALFWVYLLLRHHRGTLRDPRL